MISHQLFIQAHHRPEILERILRVIRHRGFKIKAMNVVSVSDINQIAIDLTVSSQRPIALLSNQLIKLFDIIQVKTK